MSDIKDWFTALGNNIAAPPDGAPEGMARSGVNNSMREQMAATKRFYDDPEFRRPFEDFTKGRNSGVQFTLTDVIETDAAALMQDGQRIHAIGAGADAPTVFEGFIDGTPGYGGGVTTFDIVWDLPPATAGPTETPEYFEVSFKGLGTTAYKDTGIATGEVPMIDDLDPHVLKAENTLDVGFLDGQTHTQIEVKASRGRLNANGGLDVWQRGTDFNGTLANNDDNDVCADAFTIISDGIDMVDITRDTSVPATTPVRYSMKFTSQPAANNKYGIIHAVELEDSFDVGQKGMGTKVSVSFWAKTGSVAGIGKLNVSVLNLLTAEPTIDPVSVWSSGSEGGITYDVTEWEVIPLSTQQIAITAEWAEYKIEDLDLDVTFSGVGPIALAITVDEAIVSLNMSWHLAAIQFNRGSHSTPFLRVPAALERERCYRYYEKTFPEATAPADAAGQAGSIAQYPFGIVTLLGSLFQVWRFRAEKFKTPTILTYNPDGVEATDKWSASGAVEDLPPVISNTGTSSTELSVTVNTATLEAEIYRIHAAAYANIWGNN